MNADGTDVRQLTNDEAPYYTPVWSPDSKQIAFRWDQRDDILPRIFVMNADGTDVRQLTDNIINIWHDSPDWSPDGTQIVFSETVIGSDRGDQEVFVINADGTGVRQLTDSEDMWTAHRPVWSPDGNYIAFEGRNLWEMYHQEIFVINIDGTGLRKLTGDGPMLPIFEDYVNGDGENNYTNSSPDWSPDGTQITFTSNRSDGLADVIYVMNADGSEVYSVGQEGADFDLMPVWSPDGRYIAFQSNRNGWAEEIFVMTADGSEVYSTGQEGTSPDWKN